MDSVLFQKLCVCLDLIFVIGKKLVDELLIEFLLVIGNMDIKCWDFRERKEGSKMNVKKIDFKW